jgi:Tfp pilus assembly protein PilX
MTKAPGEVEPPKQITRAEREARKAFRQADAATAMSEHEIAQAAFSKNRERLKAERLAREAAAPPPAKSKPKTKKK